MGNDGSLLSIGELARRTGLPVRTIRFWSDAGVLPPATRTESGRRLYDAACADQAELVATLRELGLGLADVRRVLAGQASIAEVAAAHRDALDAQIRVLRLHRAAMAVVVKRSASDEEKAMMNKFAEMPAAERRQMIDESLAEVFQGLEPSPARAQRWAAAWDLPDDPSPGQVEAWVGARPIPPRPPRWWTGSWSPTGGARAARNCSPALRYCASRVSNDTGSSRQSLTACLPSRRTRPHSNG